MSIYDRLVAVEDQRTEALADLLERVLATDRMSEAQWFGHFVTDVLLAGTTNERAMAAFLSSFGATREPLSVATQYQIDQIDYSARPDMVVFRGSDPLFVIEVKIHAPVSDGQLERYGLWLAARAEGRYTPALVLLTQRARAPAGFVDAEIGGFGVQLRSVASWQAVAEWFTKLALEENGVEEPLKSLAREFSVHLEEEEDVPTLDDVAIARLYLEHSHERLTNSVARLADGFIFPDGRERSPKVTVESVGVYSTVWPAAGRDDNIYYGFGFKPVIEHDDTLHGFCRYMNHSTNDPKRVEITDGVYAFAYVDVNEEYCRRIPGFSKDLWYERLDRNLVRIEGPGAANSTGWWHYSSNDRGGYARICALQELLDDDGRMRNRLREWVHEALSDTLGLRSALFAA